MSKINNFLFTRNIANLLSKCLYLIDSIIITILIQKKYWYIKITFYIQYLKLIFVFIIYTVDAFFVYIDIKFQFA